MTQDTTWESNKTTRSTALERSVKIFYWRVKGLRAPTSPLVQMWIKT